MHDYLVNHIMDELNDAIAYAKKAVDVKLDHPAWAKMFIQMSDTEATHAACLKKMYEEAKLDTDEYKDGYKRIIEKFTDAMEETTKVKKMLLYWDK